MPSRPASSGGGVPAPGANGFSRGSVENLRSAKVMQSLSTRPLKSLYCSASSGPAWGPRRLQPPSRLYRRSVEEIVVAGEGAEWRQPDGGERGPPQTRGRVVARGGIEPPTGGFQ